MYAGCSWFAATYDDSGYNNYTDVFNNAVDKFTQATIVAGILKHFFYIESHVIVNQASDYKTAMLT